jgi:cell division protein FtsB
MTVSAQELVSANCSKNKILHHRRLNWKLVNRCLWVGNILLVLVCLMIVNGLATQTFALRDYKNQLADLRQQQADLQSQVTTLSSYNYLQSRVQSLGMVAVDRLSYEVTGNELLAKK